MAREENYTNPIAADIEKQKVASRTNLFCRICQAWNDKQGATSAGAQHQQSGAGQPDRGDHWSLLLVDMIMNQCSHFDSAGGINNTAAQNIVDNLGRLLIRPYFTLEADSDYPRQDNGWECGLRVLRALEVLFEDKLYSTRVENKVDIHLTNALLGSMRDARNRYISIINEHAITYGS